MKTSESSEFRKVQGIAKEQSLAVTLPKKYVDNLGIEKGDFVKIHQESNRIIIETVS